MSHRSMDAERELNSGKSLPIFSKLTSLVGSCHGKPTYILRSRGRPEGLFFEKIAFLRLAIIVVMIREWACSLCEGIFKMDHLNIKSYRYKNAAFNFFCPLCRTERSCSVRPKLSTANYVQLSLSAGILMALTAPVMGFYSIIFFFIVWMGFEGYVRWRFRREIPCPHCGFDASWYKRDVKVARKLVMQFWDQEKKNQ